MKPIITRILVSALALVAFAASAADFYVAPDGSDANPGTSAKPFASLERARDAVRALKQAGPLTAPVNVWTPLSIPRPVVNVYGAGRDGLAFVLENVTVPV